jgi:hypothetical protein
MNKKKSSRPPWAWKHKYLTFGWDICTISRHSATSRVYYGYYMDCHVFLGIMVGCFKRLNMHTHRYTTHSHFAMLRRECHAHLK